MNDDCFCGEKEDKIKDLFLISLDGMCPLCLFNIIKKLDIYMNKEHQGYYKELKEKDQDATADGDDGNL
ncbi:MAG: hypothetical protein ACFFG0_04835 [Candidatus Thorarchaeota archaeon]